MGTGIFKDSILGREEISQEDLDYWCWICQFPLAEGGCKDKADIQRCWDETRATGKLWHLLHECPFHHQDRVCICNEFKNMAEAFRVAGLTYKNQCV